MRLYKRELSATVNSKICIKRLELRSLILTVHTFLSNDGLKVKFPQKKLFFTKILRKTVFGDGTTSFIDENKFFSYSVCYIKILSRTHIKKNKVFHNFYRNAIENVGVATLFSKELLFIDDAAILQTLKNLYSLFFNAGAANAIFYTIACDSLNFDEAALNYAVLNKVDKKLLLEPAMDNSRKDRLESILKRCSINTFDFVIILDPGISGLEVAELSKLAGFSVGASKNINNAFMFDIVLPLMECSEELQYYFIGFVLKATLEGSRYNSKNIVKNRLELLKDLYIDLS